MQSGKKVLILGVTGAIGRGLPALFSARGMEVTGVSRSANPWVYGVSNWQHPKDLDVSGFDVVINLAGESVAQRWTDSNKQKFHDSRVKLTGELVDAPISTSSEPVGTGPAVAFQLVAVPHAAGPTTSKVVVGVGGV